MSVFLEEFFVIVEELLLKVLSIDEVVKNIISNM